MSNPYFRPLDPAAAPDPVTPQASPSSPEGFAAVTPHGQGPAWYDIQAEMPDVSGQYASAGAVAGAGVVYSQGPRQAAAEAFLYSDQGYGELHITEGFTGGPGGSWTSNPDPGANAQTPDQGTGDFTGTGTD